MHTHTQNKDKDNQTIEGKLAAAPPLPPLPPLNPSLMKKTKTARGRCIQISRHNADGGLQTKTDGARLTNERIKNASLTKRNQKAMQERKMGNKKTEKSEQSIVSDTDRLEYRKLRGWSRRNPQYGIWRQTGAEEGSGGEQVKRRGGTVSASQGGTVVLESIESNRAPRDVRRVGPRR